MAKFLRNVYILLILLFIGLTVAVFWNLEQRTKFPAKSYTGFLQDMESHAIEEIDLRGTRMHVRTIDGHRYTTVAPDAVSIADRVDPAEVRLTIHRDWTNLAWYSLLALLVIIVLFIGGIALIRRQDKKVKVDTFASDKIMTFSKENRITLKDVAGIDEAKYELQEIISFLKDSEPFQLVGATIPKGVLLQGPPGTGKTLLAKAIAGESGVAFYSISGSDFVEKYVGVGASRIRELFQAAKKNAPCIIFIDEIDAVGASRAAGGGQGGQDERGQTLNALLVEMDGFATDDTILVLAATNRPDVLDPALLRPGRFDRQVTILAPDVKGRRQILEVHARNVRINKEVKLDQVARSTPGFTGAELHNLINEAALLAARERRQEVMPEDFEAAKDRITLGVERKGLVLSDNDRTILAHHEAGHALLARNLPDADPLLKITIIPRGQAMGQTQQIPLTDRHAYTKDYLMARITILMGGRAAEELIFNQYSTGASQDLMQATEIAIAMVCQWGMSQALPPRAYMKDAGGFLGGARTGLFQSQGTEEALDHEINAILQSCHLQAREILEQQEDFLRNLAEILLKTETLDSEELDIIFDCTLKKRDSDDKSAAACTV